MKIITKSGFKCSVNDNIIKDWRFITLTSQIAKASDEISVIDNVNKALVFILGEKDTQKLIEHVAKTDGIADVKKVIGEYSEILTMLKDQVKKSQSLSE